MSTKAKIIVKKVTAVLKWPSAITEKLKRAKFIQSKITGNVNFPTPYPANVTTLVQFGLDITALDTAITTSGSKAKGSSDAVNALVNTVHNDLLTIMTMVQNKSDSNPANAEVVIEGAGYDVKKSSTHGARQNTAVSHEEGIVKLTAVGKGAHQWQQSPDGGATTEQLNPTLSGKQTVIGLTGGAKVWFRNRLILPGGNYGDWSDWIAVRVK